MNVVNEAIWGRTAAKGEMEGRSDTRLSGDTKYPQNKYEDQTPPVNVRQELAW